MLYSDITASNQRITEPLVAVFCGGTAGIGKFTIEALVKTDLNHRIYLVGRKSSEERMQQFVSEQRAINPKADIIWIEADITLLKDCTRVCRSIIEKETTVDLLFLSAGYAPLGARHLTSEGLEIAQVLEYYSRILFILHFLPLLRKSSNPRVVCVGAGGMERAGGINVNDFDLSKPGNWGIMAQSQYGMMNSVGLEKLAMDNPDVTFIHSWPGIVATGNADRSADPGTFIDWFFWLIVKPLISLLSKTFDESGQRHLFLCTSAYYGGKGVPWDGEEGLSSREKDGKGVYLTHHKNQCTPNARNMAKLREQAQEKQWQHTMEVLKQYM